ncbi:MAG: hypothetical protein JW863_21040, partial [Chitinispirillaceae bacterium]|nr:hypothetical protein [Chitinispirillaceae bacterium]
MTTRRACIGTLCSCGALLATGNFSRCIAGPAPSGHPARFWHREGTAVACELCPHGCVLPEGKTGTCRNRMHRDGKLIALGYAQPCAVHVDPIEKKP